MRQPEELKNRVIGKLGASEEHLALDNVDPVAAKQAFQPLQLLGVLSTGAVGVVLVAVADVPRVGHDPFGLTCQPRRLKLQRSLERFALMTEERFVGMGRLGTLHRVAHQHEQLHTGQVARDSLRSKRMEHVIGTGLEGHRG